MTKPDVSLVTAQERTTSADQDRAISPEPPGLSWLPDTGALTMNAAECNRRAAACAANAALAGTEVLSLEFLKLAAQWRAMAVREIFLGFVDGPAMPALAVPNPDPA